MWLRSDGLYCDTRPFSEEECNSIFLKKQQTAFSTPMMTEEHITGSMSWAYFFGLTNVLLHVCLTTLPMRISHEATDHFLMFVCHNNMFMLMFFVVSLVVLLTVSYFFLSLFWHIWGSYLQNYRPGLHSLVISGALCDQSVVFSCITCLCLTFSVKLNKPF